MNIPRCLLRRQAGRILPQRAQNHPLNNPPGTWVDRVLFHSCHLRPCLVGNDEPGTFCAQHTHFANELQPFPMQPEFSSAWPSCRVKEKEPFPWALQPGSVVSPISLWFFFLPPPRNTHTFGFSLTYTLGPSWIDLFQMIVRGQDLRPLITTAQTNITLFTNMS